MGAGGITATGRAPGLEMGASSPPKSLHLSMHRWPGWGTSPVLLALQVSAGLDAHKTDKCLPGFEAKSLDLTSNDPWAVDFFFFNGFGQ